MSLDKEIKRKFSLAAAKTYSHVKNDRNSLRQRSRHSYKSQGSGWVVRSHEIKYIQPAFIEEPIIVHTWVADLQKFSSLRRYEMVRVADNCLLATASTRWAYVDYATGRLMRIPEEVIGAFEILEAETLER